MMPVADIHLAMTRRGHPTALRLGAVVLLLWCAACGTNGSPRSALPVGTSGAAVATAIEGVDWNRDGAVDVVVARPGANATGLLFIAGTPGGKPRAVPWTEGRSADDLATVTPAGDIDGDGYRDVLLLQPHADESRGAVQLLRGGAAAVPAAAARLRGDRPGARLGAKAVALGDVDGDGYGDVGVLAAGGEVPASTMPSMVPVMVPAELRILGGGRGGLQKVPHQVLALPDWNVDHLLAIDVDGDGTRDLVAVGCDSTGSCEGRGWTRKGAKLSASFVTVFAIASRRRLQRAIVAGDVDGDGHQELAATSDGTLYVFTMSGRLPAAPRWQVADPSRRNQSWFGQALIAGNFDGDGLADIVVGASGVGALYVYRGSRLPITEPETRSLPAGESAVELLTGDLDRDGFDELVAVTTGEALVYRGGHAGSAQQPSWRFRLP